VVRLAWAAGVDVPRHASLYASLLPQEKTARGEIEGALLEPSWLSHIIKN
jgi:hypothetical protein